MKRDSIFVRLLKALGKIVAAFFNLKLPLKIVLPALLILFIATSILTKNSSVNAVGGKADYDEAMRYIEIKDTLEDNYIADVDRDSMGASAAAAMVSGLGDKWSYYMTAEEYATYQLYNGNEYADIGISLSKESSGYRVVTVEAGSAAAIAGLETGMIITSVDGTSVVDLDQDQIRTLIRSKLNSSFTLGIGSGTEIVVDCTQNYATSVTYELEKTESGYVHIADFEAGSGADATAAIEDLLLQGATSLVIDLRDNPGGLTEEMRVFLDYLLPSGDLFSISNLKGEGDTYTSDSVCVQLPTCVLVNANTFAEAEVCAQVLKEFGWATLIGEPTTGMTRMQDNIVLSDGSVIHLSTKGYITANGTDLAAAGGVIPDMIVYQSESTMTSEESEAFYSDAQLTAALRYLS